MWLNYAPRDQNFVKFNQTTTLALYARLDKAFATITHWAFNRIRISRVGIHEKQDVSCAYVDMVEFQSQLYEQDSKFILVLTASLSSQLISNIAVNIVTGKQLETWPK